MQPHIPEVTLLEEVGRGRGGVVFRAIHRGNACTIKLPSDRPAAAPGMFEQEVLQLARLSAAGLPRVWQLDSSADIPYAILDEPEGEPFVRVFGRATDEKERVRLALTLASSLKQLHDAGFVHGGLTAASVRVSSEGTRVALRDLGSVSRPVPFDPRVDLRALGSLLCECLARLDRSATASWSLLRPANELAMGSRTDLASVIAELEQHADLPHKPPSSYPPPSREFGAFTSNTALARPARSELAQLCRHWDAALDSGGKVIEIIGAPGSGKSRLLAAFADEIARRDGQVLFVCSRDADWAPFSTLKRMLEGHIAGLASLEPERRQQVERALVAAAGPMASQIGLLSPRLAALFRAAGATISLVDAQQVFVAGLADFLARYLEAGGRSALIVDDIHWMDANSRTVLARVAAKLSGERGHVCVCAARDDHDSREILDRFRSALGAGRIERLPLGPLKRADASKLIAEYLGIESQPPRELVQRLSRLSDGTPLNVLELIRLALEGGHLRPRAGVWELDPVLVQSMRLPASSLALIERRLALLDDATMDLLRSAAVLRGAIDAGLLARSSGMSIERVQSALETARSARLLESDADGKYWFVHDCIWEALQHSVPAQQQREIHQRAAELLSETEGDGPGYELARHYAAGVIERNPSRTFTATWRAAQSALEAFDDILALSLLKSAALAAANAAIEPGAEFYLALAETSLRTGATRESLLHFERALERSALGFDRAHVLGRIAWVHYVESKTDLAWRNIEAALRECGARVPTDSAFGFTLAATRWSLGSVGLPAGTLQPRQAAVLCGLYAQCLRVSVDSGFPARGISSALLMSSVSKQLPPCRLVVQSELFMAFCFAVTGADRVSRKHSARAEAMSLELGDPIAQTLCHQIKHVIAGWRGDIVECERQARICVDERGHWMEVGELSLVCLGMYLIESARGRPLIALEWTQRAIDRVAQHGSAPAIFALIKEAACTTLAGLDRDRAVVQLEQQLRFVECADLKAQGCYELWAYSSRAQRFAERGELGEEFEALIEEFDRLDQNPKQVHLGVASYYLQVAHARVHQCLRAAPADRTALLPKLRRALADLEAATRIEALGSHTEVVRAAYEWFSGAAGEAEKSLLRAEHLARQYGVVWASYAVARLRAHMLRAAGQEREARDQARVAALWAQNYAQVSCLRCIQEEFELSETLGEPPRNDQDAARARRQLHALLRISQANSRELGPDRQARMVLDELLDALGAARAFLFMRADEANGTGSLALRAAAGRGGTLLEPTAEYDRRLIDQVYTTGQMHPADGQLSREGRTHCSCIVVALVLREQAVGVLYLDRPESEEGFRPEDFAVLQALANQVPIALELGRVLRERERLQLNLRQAQKMEAIGRLAGGIAHDFNNILATIQFAGDSLAMAMPVDQEGLEDLQAIRDSARRGSELTRQLLAFSRDTVVPPRRIILGDVIRGLLPTVRRLIRSEVRLEVEIDSARLPTLVDPTDVERILLNLCQNANDAIQGRGTISIQVGRAPHEPYLPLRADLRPGTAFALLTVSDTGTGMNDEVRQRLFEPFFTTKSDGTGLGLANVYAIVQRCNGHIDVTSELDVGSAFRICLPLVDDVTQEANEVTVAHERVEVERPEEHTILVVDDDETIRRGLTRSLKRAGYHVLSACDGEDALRVVEAYDGLIDVAISDVHMPGMGGWKLMAALLQRDPDIKPLLMSNDSAPELARAGLVLRKAAFLRKPFEEAALLALVESLLQLRPAQPQEHRNL
jgi:signal transduction histidine kinase/CheY-like chemotaxis protein